MLRRSWWNQPSGEQGAEHRRYFLAAAALAIAGIVTALSFSTPWRLADARSFDFLSTISLPKPDGESPIVIAIDEPALAEIGLRWPWPRELHGRLVEALRSAGARAIGLDIIFAEPSDPESDRALAAALGPDTVLAADEALIETPHADQLVEVKPLLELLATGAAAGIATIALDGDGVLRKIPHYRDSFAASLLQAAGKGLPERPSGALMQVFGPQRTFPTVSYYQALDPAAFLPEGFFRGRTVIIGFSTQSAASVDSGGPDSYATSDTLRSNRLLSGAEVQATIYDNLARGLFILPAPSWAGMFSVFAGVLVAAGIAWRGTGWHTVVWGVAACFAFFGLSGVLLHFGRVFVAPLAPSMGFLGLAIAQSAYDYAAERRLRRGIARAFSQYVSPVLVDRLARDPSLLKLGGETRTLTILFCDVRGFTAIAESMKDDPERLTSLINRLLNPLSNVIIEAGGTIDKYMGDCVMAFWNAPLEDPDHALHAVQAALDMIAALEKLNGELAEEARAAGISPVAFKLGIGINTGSVVVGNMGSHMRFDYSALGDAVNLASRLEGETKTFFVPVLIGPDTARLVASHFSLTELGEVRVKGKSESVAVSTLTALLPAADKVERVA
ncbi:adenylate/guanylate cyclase domain-containing protein [Chelativorans sp.]|uniref:CHASE2 domain-containing protein n=1 Tax=Chelativorans sp. TaxID=2203393 RepID=UPI0028118F89|nr:adenylate/guanylate cyclase domain-containing protein [Chelativorans sp.]